MIDKYLPPLNAFSLTPAEDDVIAEAMKSASPWDFKPPTKAEALALKNAKDKILAYHLARHDGNCCYCRSNLNGAGPYMTDREHILPKGQAVFKLLSFTMWNLAASCKRCNLQFKKSDDSFVLDKQDPAKFILSDNYLFIHPNFDLWEDHLCRLAVQVNTENIVLYARAASAKAQFTYDFFDLTGLEIDSFDRAQGLSTIAQASGAVAALRQIAATFGQ